MTIDMERAFKLPKERRYFNISVLWIFYYTRVIRLLYRINIRHEAVTLLSLASGIAAGIFLLRPGYSNLVLFALFAHLKDVFDASDGSLARMKGQTNRIARFLDSLCDFVAISWLLAALAIRLYPQFGPAVIPVACAAWISIFLQCSYFNFYLVSYTKLYGATNVRTDERRTGEDKRLYGAGWKRILLFVLQRLYAAAYGWQDRLIATVDRASYRRAAGEHGADAWDGAGEHRRERWYGDAQLMTLASPLCFGTHLFIFIVCALLSYPGLLYYIVILPGNVLLVLNIYIRERRYGRLFRQHPTSGVN